MNETQQSSSVAAARRKAVSAAGIGNFVEWFDFGIYAQFATVIAAQFFPSDDPTASLLAAFAAFAVGFLARPIGGVIFGHVGDRVGRKAALTIAIVLMTLATVAIGLTPGFATIGVAAPLLLVVWRVLQGLSAGGEYSGSSTFIIEYAPRGRRALFASINPVTVVLGTASGALVALAVTQLAGEVAVADWAWRIPFLIAAPFGLVGLFLRLRVQDTPEFQAVKRAAQEAPHPPIVEAFRVAKMSMLIFLGWCILNAVGFYLLAGYMVAYNTTTVGLSSSEALTSYIIALVVYGVAGVLAGLAADRFGRRPVAIVASVAVAITVVPAFLIMNIGGIGFAILGQSLYAVATGAVALLTPLFMVEMFPTSVRYTASALSYNIGLGVFGGTAPYLATWLVGATGNPSVPSYYVVAVSIIGLVVALFGLHRFYGKRTPAAQSAESAQATS